MAYSFYFVFYIPLSIILRLGLNQNIRAPEVNLTGTVRALDLEIYNAIMNKLQKLIDGLSLIYDVEIKMEIGLYYPSLLNDISVHKKLHESLNKVSAVQMWLKQNQF